jgi:hypothetical protein
MLDFKQGSDSTEVANMVTVALVAILIVALRLLEMN